MIAISSDNVVTLDELYDTVGEAYVNDATVSCVLKDSNGGTLDTINLLYVAGSNGKYRGTISAAVSAELGRNEACTLECSVSASGLTAFFLEEEVAGYQDV